MRRQGVGFGIPVQSVAWGTQNWGVYSGYVRAIRAGSQSKRVAAETANAILLNAQNNETPYELKPYVNP